MPGAKLGLVDYHPNEKTQKSLLIAFDEVFIVAKFIINSASANSLKLNSIHTATHLHNLLICSISFTQHMIPHRKLLLILHLS